MSGQWTLGVKLQSTNMALKRQDIDLEPNKDQTIGTRKDRSETKMFRWILTGDLGQLLTGQLPHRL